MPAKIPQPVTMTAVVLPESEDAARDYLIRAGILHVPSFCPVCGCSEIRHIRRHQCRCRRCRHESSIRKGSILEGRRMSFRTFLAIVRYFADDLPANDAASRMGIAYNTVYEMYHLLRDSMLVPAAGGNRSKANHRKKSKGSTGTAAAMNRFAGPAPYHNDGSAGIDSNIKNKQVVFGIRFAEGTITISQVLSPDPEIITALPIPTTQRGNILFIDAYGKMYQGFITYLPKRNGRDLVHIKARDGMPWSPLGDFWTFAGRIWTSHRGLDREQIPSFILELAFRYNNRDRDLFSVLLEKIAESYTGH